MISKHYLERIIVITAFLGAFLFLLGEAVRSGNLRPYDEMEYDKLYPEDQDYEDAEDREEDYEDVKCDDLFKLRKELNEIKDEFRKSQFLAERRDCREDLQNRFLLLAGMFFVITGVLEVIVVYGMGESPQVIPFD